MVQTGAILIHIQAIPSRIQADLNQTLRVERLDALQAKSIMERHRL
jgi:hypothetical protein